jgi:hypothetical protein
MKKNLTTAMTSPAKAANTKSRSDVLTTAQLTKRMLNIQAAIDDLSDAVNTLEDQAEGKFASANSKKAPTPDYAALAEAELRLRCFEACMDAVMHRDEVTFRVLLGAAVEACEEIEFGPRLLASMTMMKEREHFGLDSA